MQVLQQFIERSLIDFDRNNQIRNFELGKKTELKDGFKLQKN